MKMHDLDLKSLRLFATVCDLGNLKDAALQEHIEPSAVSKRLTQMEEALGAQVLIRRRTGATPTPVGQVLLEHARAVLLTVDRLRADLASLKGGVKGLVRIVASPSAIAESLLDDISQFMRAPEHDGIQVNIEERFSKDIVDIVRDRIVSLGICWNSANFGELDYENYRHDELMLAVPIDHPLAKQRDIWFGDTVAYEHIGLQSTAAVTKMLNREAAKAGRPLNYRVVVTNFDAAYRVVAAGLGISVIPREVSSTHIAANSVKLIKLRDPWTKRQFAICFRNKNELTPAAKKLLEFLANKARRLAE